MEFLQSLFSKKAEPTSAEQVQKTRDDLFAKQLGLNNQIEQLQTRNQLLGQQFIQLPESSPSAQQLFLEMKRNDSQITAWKNQLTIVQRSLDNLNTTDSSIQLMTDVHASNQATDRLMKESRTTIGAPPTRVMNRLQTTSEKTQDLTNMINEASLGIHKNEMEVSSTSMAEEMAKYKQDLANSAAQQRRTMVVDSMPAIPLGQPVSSQPIKIPTVVPREERSIPVGHSMQEPNSSMHDWYSVMQAANNHTS